MQDNLTEIEYLITKDRLSVASLEMICHVVLSLQLFNLVEQHLSVAVHICSTVFQKISKGLIAYFVF